MLKLNESRLEIEISSPTELLAWAEDFKRHCERYQTNASEIIKKGSTDKGCFVESFYKIGSETTLRIFWKPKFDSDHVVNL